MTETIWVNTMPFPVYILGFTLFAMTTSEFMVAGLLTSMAADLQVSVPAVGYLITLYSLGMVVGGPLLAALLVRAGNKTALLVLTLLFLLAQTVATLAPSYWLLAIARLVTGLSSAAFFGFALMAAAKMVPPSRFGVAASIVLGGMMIATVVGLPLSVLLDRVLGWRAAFALIVLLTLLAAVAIRLGVPAVTTDSQNSLRDGLHAVRDPRLWAVYSTSFCIIAATFAAFSYVVPYLENVAHFSARAIPGILFAYGLCTVVGNIVVGRVSDRSPVGVQWVGGIVLVAALAGLSVLGDTPLAALLMVMLLGLTGITLTPAMSARVFRVGGNSPLVNTLHTSVICLGVVTGSWGGGYAIAAGYGFRAPVVLGVGLALLALLTLLPSIRFMRRPAKI